jgi:hypothetical protein
VSLYARGHLGSWCIRARALLLFVSTGLLAGALVAGSFVVIPDVATSGHGLLSVGAARSVRIVSARQAVRSQAVTIVESRAPTALSRGGGPYDRRVRSDRPRNVVEP